MSEQKPLVANLTIDLRRNRFRIHQDTIHNLGNPAYIQFLINPEDGFIAILGSEKPLAGGTANKVTLYNASRSKSAEFYSSNLMNSIFKIFGSLDFRFNYRLTGEIDQVNRVAYYSMQTLQRVERRTLDDRQRI